MNEFELSNQLLVWLLFAMAVLLMAVGGVAVMLYRSHLSARQDLGHLSAQLNVFAHASIEVARAVDGLISNEPKRDNAVASRRWLLDEARARLADGEDLALISQRLRLNDDEISLLHRLVLLQQISTD